jgi:outer membrane protein TolC
VVNQGKRDNIPLTFNNSFIAGASLRQLVFDGGKWWNNISGAQLGLSATRASVDEQRLQTIYLVEQRFYELVRAQRQLRVLADAATRSRDQAGNVQRLFEGGRSTQADVYQARANRDNDEIVRLGQERVVELARADLALAIGVDPSEPLNVVEPPRLFDDPAQPPAAHEAVQRALANRPSLKAFALQAEAQRKFASAARGDYWPTVTLDGSYSRNARDLQTFDDPNLGLSSQLTGSVNLSWNLFAGFATDANVRKAEVLVRLSENDLQNGRRNVAADVEKAIAQLATARTQVHVAVQAVETAREGLRLAKTRQIVGVGTELEVRDAELKLTQSELAHVGALVDGREAEAALRRAQGG